MTQQLRMDLTDYVHELTSRHQHREHYQVRDRGTWYGRDHTTTVPALIDQLRYASPSGNGQDRGTSGYGSRPTARLEALDALERIDGDADWWIRHLARAREGRDTARAVQFVASLRPGLTTCTRRRAGCCDAHELEYAVRRWWTQARIVTGWDSPAWRPDNTCPLCGERGGLRVRLADQSAFCAECGETWTPETIALLADHIRGENHDGLRQNEHHDQEAS